ncbi:hypothetical protein J6Y50_07275 [bacterium]|nr:hypothetical protein [bacterium]
MKKIWIFLVLLCTVAPLFADKPVLAVMDFVDDTEGQLSERFLKGGSKLIRARITRKAKKYFTVRTDEDNEKALAEMRKTSHRIDRSKEFQIELGKQVSANKIIRATVTHMNGEFQITAFITDITRETDDDSADAIFDGTLESLQNAVDKLIGQLLDSAEEELEAVAYREALNKDSIRAWDQYILVYGDINQRHSNKAEERIKYLKEHEEIQKVKRKEEEAEAETKTKKERMLKGMKKDARDLKISGISLIVGGSVILIAGVTAFAISSDNENDQYHKMTKASAISEAISNGEDKASYIHRADKHRDKSKTYRNMAITSGVVGAAIVGTGAVLTVFWLKKRDKNAKMNLNRASVIPTENGFYASLGFNF